MKFIIRTEEDFSNILVPLRDHLNGKPYQVTIRPFKRDRTLAQNAKVYSMLRLIGTHTGYTEKQMHDIACAMFAPMQTVEVGHRVEDLPKGTSDMNVEEMSDFIENLYQLGAELGVTFEE